MQELETLLNSLIQRGWKPANFPGKSEIKISEDGDVVLYMNTEDVTLAIKVKLRNLVSLESGLWQFCMENGLCKGDIYERIKADLQILGAGESHQSGRDYQYRLIESALVPEEELVKFLLDNIIVKGKKE